MSAYGSIDGSSSKSKQRNVSWLARSIRMLKGESWEIAASRPQQVVEQGSSLSMVLLKESLAFNALLYSPRTTHDESKSR